MVKHVAPKHMAIGGSIFLSYDLITEFMRHHDENNLRPKLVDHMIAMCLIGTFGGLMTFNTIRGAFQGFLFFGINIGLLTYWAMCMGTRPGAGIASSNMYYDKDVTQAEKERFEMLDQTEILAYNMGIKPAYGMMDLVQKYQ